jgi:N-acetylneuraminic acid mutarotase
VQATSQARAQQSGHAHHGGLYESLQKPGRIDIPETAATQHVFDSPAPKAANPGRWVAKAPLPLPRSEMAWAVAHADRMHLVGGYGEQASTGPTTRSTIRRSLDRFGCAAQGRQSRRRRGARRHPLCHRRLHRAEPQAAQRMFPSTSRTGGTIAPCRCVRGHRLVGLARRHRWGHRDTSVEKKSVDWHLVYDPKTDRWENRRPMPTGRDHTGVVAIGNRIHLIGGRVDSFHTNSNLHHAYDTQSDKWIARRPLPTARSGHGAVLYRGKIFVMGGEGTNRVFGQNEAYNPVTDQWESYAPMVTPRHGLGAAVVGDAIHVAGGGPVMGGGVQSAVHEAFTLG